MDNRYEIAEHNGMSREFADWFFDNKKAGCGNVWFMMMAAMWEGWQGRASMLDNCTTVELRGHAGCRTKNGLNCHAMHQGADGNSPAHSGCCPAQNCISPAQCGNLPVIPECSCHACRPVTFADSRFVVCPDCGNKRCPHANDHRNACTGSNEPGQEGSAYPAAQQQEVK
ncbi:TPA: hypothetical protein ACW7ZX_003597 [Enterobacter roggenkampii]